MFDLIFIICLLMYMYVMECTVGSSLNYLPILLQIVANCT